MRTTFRAAAMNRVHTVQLTIATSAVGTATFPVAVDRCIVSCDTDETVTWLTGSGTPAAASGSVVAGQGVRVMKGEASHILETAQPDAVWKFFNPNAGNIVLTIEGMVGAGPNR